MKKIRLLIVDSQSMIREGLAAILSNYSDIEVIGQAADGLEAVQAVRQARPDVVTLELFLPSQDGLVTMPLIRKIAPQTRILVVTAHAENEMVRQALQAGALGYVLKDASRQELLQAIREVAQGRAFLQSSLALSLIQESNHTPGLPPAALLTRRELETLCLIAHGLSNQEIAAKLTVSERTVAKYVSSVLSKLHLANRTQAALYALRENLTDLCRQPAGLVQENSVL